MARRESSLTITIRLEKDLKDAWERAARGKGMSRNAWVIERVGDPRSGAKR